MKIKTFVTCAILLVGSAIFAQQMHPASALFRQEVWTKLTPNEKFAFSAAFRRYHTEANLFFADGEQDYRKTKAFKRALQTRKEGLGLIIAGPVSLAGGVPLLTTGIINFVNDINQGTSSIGDNFGPTVGHYMEIVFGALFTAAGVGMSIPGAILLAKGTQRMKKAKATYSN